MLIGSSNCQPGDSAEGNVLSVLMQVTNRDAHAQFYIPHDIVPCPRAIVVKQ